MVGKDKVIHLDQYRQSQVFEEAEGSLDWFDEENANAVLAKLDEIGKAYNVTFVISISVKSDVIDAAYKENIIAEL